MLKDSGIFIKRNDFLSQGIIVYEDTYGNSVFMKREQEKDREGFVAKFRPSDKNVKAESIHVGVPIKSTDEGTMLHLDYLDGVIHDGEDVKAGISMFTELVQRWINLMYDIRFMQSNNKFLLRTNDGCTEDDICRFKLMQLGQYEELKAIMELV